MSRYFRRSTAINSNKQYKNILDKKGRNHIEQYRTPVFRPVDEEIIATIEIYDYVFHPGDAYWKISNNIYGDPSFWWVIASFNRKPTLAHCKAGDIIRVPVELSIALEALE